MAGRGSRTSPPEADPASVGRASDPDATGATAAAPTDPASGPPRDIRRSAWWWIRAAAVLTTIFLTVQLLGVVQSFLAAILTVVLYVLFGAVIAFIAGPIVQQLEQRLRLPQVPAILLTLLSGLALVVLLGFLITAPIVDEASQLSKQGPALIKQINDIFNSVRDQLAAHGIQLSGNGISSSISTDVSTRVAAALLNAVYSTLNILIDILVTLVVAFWMLKDGEELRSGVVNLLPGRFRSEANFGLDAFGVVVGGYVRGQLVRRQASSAPSWPCRRPAWWRFSSGQRWATPRAITPSCSASSAATRPSRGAVAASSASSDSSAVPHLTLVPKLILTLLHRMLPCTP